jgi:hypothetical protein
MFLLESPNNYDTFTYAVAVSIKPPANILCFYLQMKGHTALLFLAD